MKFYTQFKCWGQTCISLKFLLVMKLTIVFLITAFLQASLAGYAQKITLSEKNASLEQVFRQIRSQTGYNVLCDADLIKTAKPVAIQVKNVRIEEALEKCLAGQSLTYTIKNNTVIVQRKPVPPSSQAPPGIIKGKVRDSEGITLPAVTVKLEGASTQTTVTDNNGNYSFINLPAGSYTLSFTYLGFATTTREVTLREGQESLVNVSLTEETSKLNEVVVVGYGTQKKESLTGAISNITAKDIQTTTHSSLAQSLQGKIAGLQIRQNTGQPGDFNTMINIRGFGAPLYVNAYSDEPSIRTTLLEGSVRVSLPPLSGEAPGKKRSQLLKPGQQSEVNETIKVSNADTEEAVAWKSGYFMFNNENIPSIMRKISRWYNVDIEYRGNISQKALWGSVSRFKNVSEVTDMLELTGSVHFKIEERRIIVMP